MSQHMQAIVLDDTIDVDIFNCAFVLLREVVERLQLPEEWLAPIRSEIDLLRELATSRDELIVDEMHMSNMEGKLLLLRTLNGSKDAAKAHPFLARVRRLGHVLEGIGAGSMYEEYVSLASDASVQRPLISVISHMYRIMEAAVIRSLVEFCLYSPCTHLSLHHDGVRVDRARFAASSDPDFCTAAAAFIHGRCGLLVTLRVKTHHTLLQLFGAAGVSADSTTLAALPSRLGFDGECVPAAFFRPGCDESVLCDYIKATPATPRNMSALPEGTAAFTRSYGEVSEAVSLQIHGRVDLPTTPTSRWAMHLPGINSFALRDSRVRCGSSPDHRWPAGT